MKLIKTLILIGSLAIAAVTHAQTLATVSTNANGSLSIIPVTNAPPVTLGGLVAAGKTIFADLQGATNWAVVPYMSYGLDNHRVGGGILGLYDFNDFIGSGIGVDELGSLSLVSANVQLKLPLKPLAFTGWSWATNLVTIPFVYSGVATAIGGTSGSGASTIEGYGANFDIAHVFGGTLGIGAAYTQRQNAGIYSGDYIHGLLDLRWGF